MAGSEAPAEHFNPIKKSNMKTLKKISRRIKQHATKEIRCILKRQGYDYTLREIRNMLYYDKQLKSWAVRVLIEKYSRRELGAVICEYEVFTSRYFMGNN